MKKFRTTVRDKGQITIPAEVRKAAGLVEGDSVEVKMTADGILLKPHKLIDGPETTRRDDPLDRYRALLASPAQPHAKSRRLLRPFFP